MKLKGRKLPKYTNRPPIVRSTKAGSFRASMKSLSERGFRDGGMRDLMNMFATTSNPSIMKATARIVQPNPICGISFVTMMGRMTPPRLDPVTMIPMAAARCLRNQELTAATAKIRQHQSPHLRERRKHMDKTRSCSQWRYTRFEQGRTGKTCLRSRSSSSQTHVGMSPAGSAISDQDHQPLSQQRVPVIIVSFLLVLVRRPYPEEQHERLCGRNPCDRARRIRLQLMCLIVILEDANA